MASSTSETEGDSDESLEVFGSQLSGYERQLRKHLKDLDAKIDSYRFSIEKDDDSLVIDLALKTTIRLKKKNGDE